MKIPAYQQFLKHSDQSVRSLFKYFIHNRTSTDEPGKQGNANKAPLLH